MLKVRFFATLKDLAGTAEMELPLTKETPVSEVFHQLELELPGLASYRSSLMIAVNQEYAEADSHVSPGDELCLFPPVSGGHS